MAVASIYEAVREVGGMLACPSLSVWALMNLFLVVSPKELPRLNGWKVGCLLSQLIMYTPRLSKRKGVFRLIRKQIREKWKPIASKLLLIPATLAANMVW